MKTFAHATKARDFRRRRLPILESLEGRMVLSVCGVECNLVGDVLNISGSPSNDAISVVYDKTSASLRVSASLPSGEEFIGQYPVQNVASLNFSDLTSNDRYTIDSELALEVTLDANLSAPLDPALLSIGPFLSSSGATQGVDQILQRIVGTDSSTLQAAEHNLHDAQQAEGYSTTHESSPTHEDHSSLPSSAGSVLSPTLMPSGHGHEMSGAAFLVSTAVAHSGSIAHSVSRQASSSDGEPHGDSLLKEHSDPVASKSTTQTSSKLVPKRCTVTLSGGVVVTAVTGKRQCDCDAKATAAKEVSEQLSPKEIESGGKILMAATSECVPCQGPAWLSGLPAEFQTCSISPRRAGLPLLILDEQHDGPSCPLRSEAEDLAVTETAWLENLQYVGWPLLAASVVLIPTLFERRVKEDRESEDDTHPAVDWLFGRFNCELLMAR